MCRTKLHRWICSLFFLAAFAFLTASQVIAQQAGPIEGRALYKALKKFDLQGKATVSKLALKRDLAEMVFTGDFYFSAPINCFKG